MKKPSFTFHVKRFLPWIIILGVLIFQLILFGHDFWDSLPGEAVVGYKIAVMIILCFVIFYVIHIFYERPLIALELTIKKFLVGALKEEDIKSFKTGNPQLDYIVLFFKKTIHTLKDIKSEFIHGKAIKGEVELGKEIQGKLLNKKVIDVPYLEIVAKSLPAGEIGGDSYDVIKQEDNYYIYVGDATGHGVGAGFIMMIVNSLISAYAKVTEKGNHIISLTNDIVKPRVKANLLMSLLLVRWNSQTKKMYMTGAGHEYLMIYKYRQQKCFSIKSGGVAIGMVKDIHKLIKEQEISFEENDVIVLYSDGITEAINKPSRDGNEAMFGEERLIKTIEESPEVGGIKTARTIFKNISMQLSKFMGYKFVQLDDITLVTIQYKSDKYFPDLDVSENLDEELITEWNWER
ncbi:serine/threonine-protein phosphatase [Candidatus Gracilibacteria bacterium]|nr:serine/threonine-protein phosphatase [Candidatus Gracilibacteria bacterium]